MSKEIEIEAQEGLVELIADALSERNAINEQLKQLSQRHNNITKRLEKQLSIIDAPEDVTPTIKNFKGVNESGKLIFEKSTEETG